MKLIDFVTLQRGHDLTESERKPGNIPVYGSFGMSGYHNTSKAKGPGVTVGRSGASFGVVNYCPVDFWPHNTALYVIDFHGNDQKFAYYYLKNLDFTRFNSGSAQASLNRNYIHPMEVKIPPLPTQHAIARILGSLDDKIELNRQMNETFEAMARAIFQSWFVEFDPVRAKAEGRETGLQPEVAALFPSEIVEVDGREVPKGWGIGTVSVLGDIISGKRPENSEATATPDKSTPLYGGGGIMGYVATPLFNQPILLTGRVGTLGEIFRITSPCWASDNTLITIPKKPEFYEYLFYILRSFNFESLNRGSTQPLVTQNDLKSQEILLPTQEILQRYHDFVKSFFKKIDKNDEQSRTLAKIRDALLPKLLSGEIHIPA